MAKFEVYASGNGFRWRLKAGNGEVVATSEEYSTKDGAKKGCEAVVRAANDAEIVEVESQTPYLFIDYKNNLGVPEVVFVGST